ncbi:phage tail tape measure C-terminal domain-containing protein [Rhodoplanes roseus]|uniref:Bacteriophage tail tape measure C-terminal domain-containing protein n=1 Tax=Rhodoplanes roseus TaxID=29409 RepID=A0A327L8G4_9BRAD|nr:phage tail tape measure C-terminal domain-containing protein [Rhodoplanes roseus]RAI43988.1 hypothetical protein CH341_11460 [Rhodoplanes roseus]
MADDTERLIVLLEAKIDQFEKNLAKASRSADQGFGGIEKRAAKAADTISANLGKAAEGVTGVFKGFGSNFLGAAGISGLGLSALLATAIKINGELAKLPGLARTAGISTDRLQEVKFAGALKGVDNEAFVTSLGESTKLLDEAQRNVNSLSRLFNANGLSIRDQNGQLIKFDQLLEIAAKLMVNTRTEQEKIKIAEMLGLSREWIGALRNGPEVFRKSAEGAHDAGAVIDSQILDKAKTFERQWGEAVVKFKAGFTSALVDLADAFGDFWEKLIVDVPGAGFIRDKLREWAGGLDGMSLPELRETLKRSVEQGLGDIEVARIQAEIDRRTKSNPLTVTVTPEVAGDNKSTVVPQDKQDNPFRSAVFEAQKRIAATDAETRSIGLNSEARERAKLVADLESAAKKANTEAGFQNATVTDEQRVKINELADAMEAAARKQRQAHAQLLQFAVDGRDFTKSFDQVAVSAFSGFESAIASVVTGTNDAKAAFSNMATSILADLAKMIIRMQITAPLAQALGGVMTGTGFSGGGLVQVPKFASGGAVSGPGSSTSDSIPAMVSNGEYIVNAAASAKHRGLLEAINTGKVSRFADGGVVRGSSAFNAQTIASPALQINSVVNNNTGGFATVEQRTGSDGFTIETVVNLVNAGIADQTSRGRGPLSGVVKRQNRLRG